MWDMIYLHVHEIGGAIFRNYESESGADVA
jgi:hypothetical protein